MLAKELSHIGNVILIDEYNTSKVCPICKKKRVIHPQENNKEIYRLCYCDNNNKHPLNMDAHKLWFNRDYVGGLNMINKLKIYLLEEQREYKKAKMKITCWSSDQQNTDKGVQKKNKSE